VATKIIFDNEIDRALTILKNKENSAENNGKFHIYLSCVKI
jgi:hypothetical protein